MNTAKQPDQMTELAEARMPTVRWAELALIASFLLLLAVVPAVQLVSEVRGGEAVQELDVFRSFPTVEGLTAYERALEDNSVMAEAARKRCQWVALVTLGTGTQNAVVGRQRTMFYRPSVDAVVAPGFMGDTEKEGHPVPAIVGFRDMLTGHGVELLVLAVPGKETIYPEWLSPRYPVGSGPPANVDMARFVEEMERQGVWLIDPTEALWEAKSRGEIYLRGDSHWTPEGLDVVADEVARSVVQWMPGLAGRRGDLEIVATAVTRRGDLYDMLKLPELPTPFGPQQVTVRRVMDGETGEPLEPDAEAAIVLLGDSFTNIYSLEGMGWGGQAGLGEQLALRLGQSVDIIAQNDGGVNTARATLCRRGDPLGGKRLVIWQFAARDLVVSNGEWEMIDVAPN